MKYSKRKLKILFLANRSPYPIIDGQTRRTYHILKGLAEKHDVYFLSLYERPEEIKLNNIRHLESFCKNVEMLPAPSKRIGFSMLWRLLVSLFSLDPYTIWRHYSKLYVKRIQEVRKKFEFDLIHCDILPISYVARNIKDQVFTLTDHDVSYLKSFRIARNSHNIFLKLFLYLETVKLKRLESNIFKNISLGITVSELDKKHLKKLCPKAIFEVIENGVDTNMFHPSVGKIQECMLVWLGGFSHQPNKEAVYHFIDNIYPLIKKHIKNVELHLIGGDVTQRLIRSAKHDSSIKTIGFVDDPSLYLAKGTVFVAPILSGSGTRLKIMEAMAMGKAIVTTSIGCEGIEGINKKHYMISDTPNEFAENVIKIINDRDFLKYIGNNARSLVLEKYDWEIICNKINILYRNIIIKKSKII